MILGIFTTTHYIIIEIHIYIKYCHKRVNTPLQAI